MFGTAMKPDIPNWIVLLRHIQDADRSTLTPRSAAGGATSENMSTDAVGRARAHSASEQYKRLKDILSSVV